MTFLTTLLKKLPRPKGKVGIDPSRDWLVLMAFSIVLIAASVAWNVSFFVSALRDEAVPAAPMQEGKESSVPALRTMFEERAKEAVRYESSVFVDPSL